jgi:hypothetical protein
MSFGYLEKSKKGLPRFENRNSSSKMIRISREKTNNCPSRIERKKESAFNMQKTLIYMKPCDFWEIIKPLTTEKGDMTQATRYLLTNLARKFTALLSNRSTNFSLIKELVKVF